MGNQSNTHQNNTKLSAKGIKEQGKSEYRQGGQGNKRSEKKRKEKTNARKRRAGGIQH